MKGLDTNVLVRYVVRDRPDQTALSDRFIESECTVDTPGFVAHIVLCELVWVLTSGYGYSRRDSLKVLEQMLRVAQFRIESPQIVWQALADVRARPADFSDFLLARFNKAHGCEYTATFDKKAGGSEMFRLLGEQRSEQRGQF